MNIVFVHKEYPGQYGPLAHLLAERHDPAQHRGVDRGHQPDGVAAEYLSRGIPAPGRFTRRSPADPREAELESARRRESRVPAPALRCWAGRRTPAVPRT